MQTLQKYKTYLPVISHYYNITGYYKLFLWGGLFVYLPLDILTHKIQGGIQGEDGVPEEGGSIPDKKLLLTIHKESGGEDSLQGLQFPADSLPGLPDTPEEVYPILWTPGEGLYLCFSDKVPYLLEGLGDFLPLFILGLCVCTHILSFFIWGDFSLRVCNTLRISSSV